MVTANDDTAILKKKWEDEDASEDESVASDWDVSSEEEEDEEEEEEKPAPKSAPAPKPKGKAAAKAPSDDESEEEEDDEASKRLRDRRLQQEADLKNAEDLFAGLTIKDTDMNNVLATINPKTQAEFDEFRKALVDRITKAQNSRLYNQFLEKLIRDLVDPLKDLDVRKIASGLTTLANEKQRAAREASKPKKKNKKATLSAPPKDQMDMADYSREDFDDYDDFM
ncbi:Translation initiation factor 3 subunit J component [Coemansia sp. RSA 2703]|nr:Translation initiation factor 3 subunit J component [Coemansia sp. RSA 2703]KAJ2373465.1 Translation initiation factor 3 subunit J component [Coemansia sp. RSA 2607]